MERLGHYNTSCGSVGVVMVGTVASVVGWEDSCCWWVWVARLMVWPVFFISVGWSRDLTPWCCLRCVFSPWLKPRTGRVPVMRVRNLGVEEESDLTSQSPSSFFAPWPGASARTRPCGLRAVGPDLPPSSREHLPKESWSGDERLWCIEDPWVTVFLKTEDVGTGTDRQLWGHNVVSCLQWGSTKVACAVGVVTYPSWSDICQELWALTTLNTLLSYYQMEHRQILDFIYSIPFLTEDVFENIDVSSKNNHVLGKLKQLSNIHSTCM